MGRDDFLVGPSNSAALAMVDQWPNWPNNAVLLMGPPGSGKSHLAAIWQAAAQARRANAEQISAETVPDLLASGAVLIDDADRVPVPERALFHLLNYTRQQSGHVLLTARSSPAHWKVALPDLLSRLNALPVLRIDEPDDALLRGVLVKHFSDYQLQADEALVSYLLTRMPRSLAAARDIVRLIDSVGLEEGRGVSRMLASRVLQAYEEHGPVGHEDGLLQVTKPS